MNILIIKITVNITVKIITEKIIAITNNSEDNNYKIITKIIITE